MPKQIKRASKIEVSMVKDSSMPVFQANSPSEIAQLPRIKKLSHCDREQFICLHLNARNEVIGYEIVAIGTLDATIVVPREVFKGAILTNAHAIIGVHNHPSGNVEPSEADRKLTRDLKTSGELLGIPLHDHIIVTPGGYFSFKNQQLL